jgi:hypothetical protein
MEIARHGADVGYFSMFHFTIKHYYWNALTLAY